MNRCEGKTAWIRPSLSEDRMSTANYPKQQSAYTKQTKDTTALEFVDGSGKFDRGPVLSRKQVGCEES